MQLFRKLLIRVCLYTQGLADGEHFEEERKLVAIPFADLCGHQRFVVLDQVEQCPFRLDVFRRQGGMRAHP